MKRWPQYNAWFWEGAPFFRILPPLAAGILCYYKGLASQVPGSVALCGAAAALGAYAALIYTKKAHRLAAFVLLHVVLLAIGYSAAWYNDARNDAQWLGNKRGATTTYLARITDAPAAKEHGWRIPVCMICCIDSGKISTVSGRALLYLYKDKLPMLLQKGDSVLLPGAWKEISNAGNPYEFDYAGYCRRNNIYHRQACSVRDIRLYGANDPDHAPLTEQMHDWCMRQLATYITDTKALGLIQAMLLGDEVNLDEDLRQSYAETGIIHIIAISGGNVGIFFVVIAFVLRWVRHKKHLWVKYAIALPLVWLYVLMAGASPSAMRAAVMFSLLALSFLLQKDGNSLNMLLATAFALLCAEPAWLFSPGFQLSFAAVLSIILFYGPVYAWASPRRWAARKVWAAVAASIAAEVLVAPVVIYYFHMFPLLFLVANVAAVLFMEAVLIAGMALVLLSWLPLVARWLGRGIAFTITVFDMVVDKLRGYSPEALHYLMLTGAELCACYVAIAGIGLYMVRQRRQAVVAGLGAACVLLLLLCRDEWQSLGQQKIVVYNAARANYAELIQGKAYRPLNEDTTSATAYAAKPTHTAWHAWRRSDTRAGELYRLGSRTVLQLNEGTAATGSFDVDYLLINTPAIPAAAWLRNVFPHAVVVLGNKYDREARERFMAEAAAAGLAVHAVADGGALVIEAVE